MSAAIVAYVPVIHAGYLALLQQYPDADVYVLGKTLLAECDWLRKDLRALSPTEAAQALKKATVLEVSYLNVLDKYDQVIMPDEDVSHAIAEKYLAAKNVVYDPIFLRWDRRASNEVDVVNPDHTITNQELAKRLILKADDEKSHSSNIWRRVGALIAHNGKVWKIGTNRHQPTDYTPVIDGDIRMNFGRGVGIEMSTDMHAEAQLIAIAAKEGRSLEGADLYVTTFPCPPCAMLVANSGIKRCYYAEGYAVLDGERVLKANGVELIKVEVELPPDRAEVYRPYPEKKG